MRILLMLVMVAGCGGVESDPSHPDGGGPDGIPGAAAHATDMAGAHAAASDGKLGSPCTTNTDCDSMICNPYPAKGGNMCTNMCTDANAATACPPPAVGCNKMGVCKF